MSTPLAERMRPKSLSDYVGQRHLLAPGKPLYESISTGKLHSMIFWGPPGTGKTSLARLIANYADAAFCQLSAVLAGVKEIREQIAEAKTRLAQSNRQTVLFVDEVHRFNKAQQDAFLPFIEDGTFFFIGATTENPSFELNNALLSRARVYVLRPIEENDLKLLIERCLTNAAEVCRTSEVRIAQEIVGWYVQAAGGDARKVLNLLEITLDLLEPGQFEITEHLAREVLAQGGLSRFDKNGEEFYNQISALHKSVRGSSPDAALYWLCRMLEGGCDPKYIARRIVRIASEDIGNADPRALSLALDAFSVQERLGSPEGELTLAQAVLYLACAPKSNAVYQAYNSARADAAQKGNMEVPLHLRNAPTSLMKNLAYGKQYRYAHDEPDAYAAGENYFPDNFMPVTYYKPVPRGLEIKIGEKLARLKNLDHSSSVKNDK